MNDGVVWLVLSTSGLLVLLNAGIGGLALWSHHSGLRVTERLIASGELDAYHATWLTGVGYRRTQTATWYRERAAAELALRALPAAGPAHADERKGLVPPPDTTAPGTAVPPEHPLTLAAWRFTRDSWSAGRPVTVKALADHPAFKAACAAHRERLAGHLPPRRTRLDDNAERAPWAAALIATGWITLNTCLLMASNAFGDPGAGPRGFERIVALLALAVGTAALAGFILVVLHLLLWRAWQDRWPRRLRTHCADLVRHESRDWAPLSRVPTG
ncbi:hypothetical protein [Streptomyces sp. IB2014 016-6]|uniref:hypothetical protein n=1 Tax=Streptomyces sp. IB2014 016-6 TaxID=2517818 RepID=UPI0011C83818|nr:hypothetical protein [Streptomyces sp. IB2014 016-6]TXL91640.1 hypothetical protein EW053_04775 [Streptomyces sp. IB2014 016-6]